MPKKTELAVTFPKAGDLMSPEEASLVSKEIVNVREEVRNNGVKCGTMEQWGQEQWGQVLTFIIYHFSLILTP